MLHEGCSGTPQNALKLSYATGCIALLLMLAAEFGLVLPIRGISVRQYLATRDRVSGTAYYVMLIVFAVMPLLVAKE